MSRRRIAVMVMAALLVSPRPGAAQQSQVVSTPADYPRGKISGLVFGDLYYNLDGDPDHFYTAGGSDTLKTNIDSNSNKVIGKDLNGLQIRRVYLQLDNDLSVRVSTRFRFEVDGKSLTTDGKLGTFVKNAYLKLRAVYPGADLTVGMLNTPTFDDDEAWWGYRAIEKTVGDFRGLAPASDLGLAVDGFVDADRRFGYRVMVGDGTAQKPEDNRYKRAYLALPVVVGDFHLEPYVDYEGASGGNSRATYKVFAGYGLPRHTSIGLEWFDRVNHKGGAANQEPIALSLFVRAMPTERLGAFARWDLWQPDKRQANRVDSHMFIAGFDWQVYKDVHMMPNIEAMQYVSKGTGVVPKSNELQARITFYYLFTKPQS
jgi:hypothetical protein